MYATILALIWLHGFKLEAKEEWELLAVKAASWLHAQNGNRHNEGLKFYCVQVETLGPKLLLLSLICSSVCVGVC